MGKLVFAWQKGIISNCHKDAEDMWSQICCLIIFPPDMIRTVSPEQVDLFLLSQNNQVSLFPL